MKRRPGVTLTEALVALFISALGMISLLTLFPLGAMQMGQALKDSRTAQSAQDADGLLRWYWAKYEANPPLESPIIEAFDRGTSVVNPLGLDPRPGVANIRNQRGPSYPVFVDPQGFNYNGWASTGGGPNQKFRMANQLMFPRRTVTTLNLNANGFNQLVSGAALERFTILQDELEYMPNQSGVPGSGAANSVKRSAQYSWSWILQRPSNDKRNLINVTVVVYYKRTPGYGDQNTERAFDNVNLVPGTTQLQINYPAGQRPEVVKGRWILDATNADSSGNPLRHAKFYRVVSVDSNTPGSLFVELETPLQRSDKGTAPYAGTVVIFNKVAEVFERPPLVTADSSQNN